MEKRKFPNVELFAARNTTGKFQGLLFESFLIGMLSSTFCDAVMYMRDPTKGIVEDNDTLMLELATIQRVFHNSLLS
jgi:hypothetical protein